MAALAERAKAHHESVQGAYEAYYGAGTGISTRPQRISADTMRSASTSAPSTASRPSTWSRIKQHAREHHESVNSAYALYYGSTIRR